MIHLIFLLASTLLLWPPQAQNPTPLQLADASELAKILAFEVPANGMPGGWRGGPVGTIFIDDKVVHSGHGAVRLERRAGSPSNSSTVAKSIPIEFSGTTIELAGFLRTEDVRDFAGLWLREDDESGSVAFDNMENQQLKGTTSWTEYSIRIPLHPKARRLYFGVLLSGTGKAWADDLRLLVDGKPVWEAPKIEKPKTGVDLDQEFDAGSGIAINKLTDIQIDNLVVLGKVWGFLKYHHPEITSGHRNWDYDLFRVLPSVLQAPDHASANAAILRWIEALGPVAPCKPCARLNEKGLYFSPDLEWIGNAQLLGADLSQSLKSIRENRAPGRQFYVSLAPVVNNPSFDHELAYANVKFPDSGFQLLALYRFWNIVEYWSPYRDIVGEDWNTVLAEFIPRVAGARDLQSYKQELLALISLMHDGHANLRGGLDARPPAGDCRLPVQIRFIEKRPVVTGFVGAGVPDLKPGDVIVELDDKPVDKLLQDWTPYYADSNEVARLRDIGQFMTRGPCGLVSVTALRENNEFTFKAERLRSATPDPVEYIHDVPGPAFRLVSKDVAYLKLSSVKAAEAAHYVEQAAGTKGFIIDIRNYPSEFMVFALGSLLVNQKTPFARFTVGDLSNPGSFHWKEPLSLDPGKPHYAGKIVVLVDETSISQAEYTTMAFSAAPGAVVVGSTTSGADGNVSRFALPGGLGSMISGIGVFYPDKRPTQRIGIVPNVTVTPTIAGIRAGRDEVLEEALRQILGGEVSAAEIEKLARPLPIAITK